MGMSTAAVAGIQGGLGVVGGLIKFLGGRKTQREAQKRIDNFKWKELQNIGDGLSVSTIGADLQREESARNLATSMDALQSGGVRGVVGGTGSINTANQNVNRQIGADLDTQQKNIDYFKAQDEARIRTMNEKRQSDELAGYGNLLDVGMNQKNQGFDTMFNAAMSGVSGLTDGERPFAETLKGVSTASATPTPVGGIGVIDFSKFFNK